MAEKKINYLARSFDSIRDELTKFSKEYYPEVSDSFEDSSVGSWIMDLMAAVGDDLSYHTDRVSQELSINSANKLGTVMNMARESGLKIPGMKPSICEVAITCTLPTLGGDNGDISKPNYDYAPILKRGSTFAAGNYIYELDEDVNFKEQFNTNGFSNREPIKPVYGNNGAISGYDVTKTAIAVNGSSMIYKKVIYANDLKPFMEIVLPETNVMSVESVIFKETSDYSKTPQLQEFYIGKESFMTGNEDVLTYRYFEVDSLADQFRFDGETEMDGIVCSDMFNPDKYEDYSEDGVPVTRTYVGKWHPITQKYITEYTDNGFIKIIFGSGNSYEELPSGYTTYGEYRASKIINNDMLGVLPKAGWTMFVLYRVGGGNTTNLGPGSINQIADSKIAWNNEQTDGATRGAVLSSLRVTNRSAAIGGKEFPDINELKNLIKYNASAQNRAVSVKDYKIKVMQMPPRYGTPFRCSVAEVNNKVELSFLGMNSRGKLDSVLNQTLVENMIEYLSHYKSINDYIEMRSGKIYNLGVGLDIFVDKNYNLPDVLYAVTEQIKAYFDVNTRDMGDSLFTGELMKLINDVDGVISLIELRIYSIYGGNYSPDKCPLPKRVVNPGCNETNRFQFNVEEGAVAEEIDLTATDGVLESDYNSMFEILSPTSDIQIRASLR